MLIVSRKTKIIMKIILKLTKLDPPKMSQDSSIPIATYRLSHSRRLWWRAWPFGAPSRKLTRIQLKSSLIPSSSRSRSFGEGRPWLWGAYLSRKRHCLLGENWVLRPCSPFTLRLLWQNCELHFLLLPPSNSLPWSSLLLWSYSLINGRCLWRCSFRWLWS